MTANEIIAARIRKYTADIPNEHPDCECPNCVSARAVLKELDYLQMAVRNLDRTLSTSNQTREP